MEDNREQIETVVRKCTDRIETITDEQVMSLVERLSKIKDIKTVVDLLALNVDKIFVGPKQKENYFASMQDLLEFSYGEYKSVDEIIAQLQKNKAQNYTPRKYFRGRKPRINI